MERKTEKHFSQKEQHVQSHMARGTVGKAIESDCDGRAEGGGGNETGGSGRATGWVCGLARDRVEGVF